MIDRLKAIPIFSTIWLINLVFRFIKVESAWKIGECLGTLCYKVMTKRRSIITYNMEVVSKAHPNIQPSATLIKSIFQRSCANLVCSIKTYGMTPKQLKPYIKINSCPEYDTSIHSNTGAILCLAHMGNWEVLSKVSSLMSPAPKKFGAIYRPLNSKVADAYVAKQRKQYGCQMFPKSTPIGILSTFIREGGTLGILADQRSGKHHKNNLPFFGVDSARSKLPAALHRRTGAPLFNVAVHSEKNGHWTIEVTPILLSQLDSTTDKVVAQVTRSYERIFLSYVVNVFWLHRYWRK